MIIVHYVIAAYVLAQAGVSLLTEYAVTKASFPHDLFRRSRVFRLVIYIALAAIPCLGAFLPKSGVKYFCMCFGNIWLGYFIYYSGLLIFSSLISLIICKVRKDSERRLFGYMLYAVMLVSAVITVYGMIHAQRTKVVTYDVSTSQKSGETLKVALLADLHLSVNSVPETTEKMVDKVNACEPDVILIAGDIFTSTYDGLKDPDRYSAALSKLDSKYGVYVVAGNHDVEENLFGGFTISPVKYTFRTPEMDRFFEDCGFKMLYDESAELDGKSVVIVGRKDAEKAGDGTKKRMKEKELLKGNDPDKLTIVLEHEPLGYEELSENGADIVLSGHTHNGQIFPGNLLVTFFNENAYGSKTLYDIPTVVTAGVGYYGAPMRVGTDSEITIVNISY